MSARRLFLAAAVSLSTFVTLPAFVVAQDVTTPEIENAKYNFQGVINSAGVNLRSGPGDNYYPTAQLEKGAPITVVGIRFDWLKVKPADGSFSYVAKAYVTRSGDGSIGTVDKPDLRVRAGSSLNAMKTTVQTTLNVGDRLTILGEADEYYKVVPPANVYLYVNKQFVDAVKTVEPIAAVGTPVSTDATANATTQPAHTETPTAALPGVHNPDTAVAETPATQPAVKVASSESVFDKLEADFVTMSKQPLDEQPLVESIGAYQALTSTDLPESLKRIVDLRLATLKARAEAKDQFVAMKKSQEEALSRQTALKAEQQELQERIKKNAITMYTAVGTLRTSSLQHGTTMLYRLTDPSNGRTLVYLRTNDAKFGGMIGQFVGVQGPIADDAQLNIRIITPSDVQAVDQSKVNNGVTATLIPPSLIEKTLSSASN